MNVLVINCGSTSVKARVIGEGEEELAEAKVERVADGAHAQAVAEAVAALGDHEIDAVGHRVVHGGDKLKEAVLIDDGVAAEIEACIPLAPLHNPANLAGIRAAREAFPDLPHVAVFDTAFHAKIPARAATYAIDPELAARHRIRRYGFHGTSHAYVADLAAGALGRPLEELKLITLHLGGGASAAAIEYGCSVDTSFGYTPLEGLVMGTRSGDIDPGVIVKLQRDQGLSVDEVEHLLNRESGLAGLSGQGADLRDIERAAADGDESSRLAISVFAHRVRRYIGAFAAVLGGADAIVFTGGIGENAAAMRRRILQRFEYLGILLDEDANASVAVNDAHPVAEISWSHARTRVFVAATNEARMIARQTASLLADRFDAPEAGPIPIAVSARHVHLDRDTFAKLFGEGATLTRYKDISQPGQYASEERVNLVGPRDRIDGVRILGPLRARNQIEVARTDEFRLGVDAPIRRSGDTKESAPIVLEGPKGKVSLSEGLICAERHVHMTPEDAERFGVENGEYVEVAIVGGPRDLVFGDVRVRVSASSVLEMHIDTDEANAAELPSKSDGELVYTDVGERMTAEIRGKRVGAGRGAQVTVRAPGRS